jgi:hypothetical protein
VEPVRRAAETGLEVVSFSVFGTTAAQLASVQAAWEVSGQWAQRTVTALASAVHTALVWDRGPCGHRRPGCHHSELPPGRCVPGVPDCRSQEPGPDQLTDSRGVQQMLDQQVRLPTRVRLSPQNRQLRLLTQDLMRHERDCRRGPRHYGL